MVPSCGAKFWISLPTMNIFNFIFFLLFIDPDLVKTHGYVQDGEQHSMILMYIQHYNVLPFHTNYENCTLYIYCTGIEIILLYNNYIHIMYTHSDIQYHFSAHKKL